MIYSDLNERSNVLVVLDRIKQAINNKEPLSMIRLGDGEGRFMAYPDTIPTNALDITLMYWFGHANFEPEMLESIAEQLRASISAADIVGLPRAKQQMKQLAYRHVINVLESKALLSKDAIVTDAAIHRYLQFGLFYKELLSGLEFVGLINGRDIQEKITRVFNVGKVKYYKIPAEAKYVNYAVKEHYPSRFLELKSEIQVPFKGAVFLVGAGGLGKIYCQWIKDKGGIALDIGAIFDSWAGEGRLQNPVHSIDNYEKYKCLSFVERIQRFNECCDRFGLDAPRL